MKKEIHKTTKNIQIDRNGKLSIRLGEETTKKIFEQFNLDKDFLAFGESSDASDYDLEVSVRVVSKK